MGDLRELVRAPLLQASPLTPYRAVSERRELHAGFMLSAEVGGPDGNFLAVFGPVGPDTLF